MNVPAQEREPAVFEPYLLRHPDDGDHRVAALVWYNRRERDAAKLKEHTRALVRSHPSNMHIYFENRWLLLSDAEYQQELAGLLEEKVKRDVGNHDIHWLLGEIYGTRAISPYDGTAEGRAKVLQLHRLPDDATLVSETTPEMLAACSRHFLLAIELARKKEPTAATLYTEQYCKVLRLAKDYDQALGLLEAELRDVEKRRPTKDYTEGMIQGDRETVTLLMKEIREAQQRRP